MKKFTLSLCLLGISGMAMAQVSLTPSVVETPVTGYSYLQNTYPYVLYQNADPSHPGNWTNASLYENKPSAVPGLMALQSYATWSNSGWTVNYSKTDSLVLDAQNKITEAIEETKYDYPGFNNHTKLKYAFAYNAGGHLENIETRYANPVTSNNFVYYANYYYFLDANGRRIGDSLTYYQAPYPYRVSYVYNANGKLVADYWVDADPNSMDTISRTFYTWSGDNLLTSYSESYDATSSTWGPSQADSLVYDSMNNIVQRVRYYLTSVDGSTFDFMPGQFEKYSYTSTGKLSEIISHEWDENNFEWVLSLKLNMLYDAGDEPFQGLIYAYQNGNWETTASQRILFRNLSGLSESQSDLSMDLYPNPAKDVVYINPSSKLNLDYTVTIRDISGRELAHSNHSAQSGIQLNTSALSEGIYFVRVTNGYETSTRKLVINQK